jgi:hypothetical protein
MNKLGEQQQRDDGNNDCAHIALEFVAEAHVKSAHHEEKDNGSREDEVVHDC